MSEKKISISLRLKPEYYEKIKKVAEARYLPVATLITQITMENLDKYNTDTNHE